MKRLVFIFSLLPLILSAQNFFSSKIDVFDQSYDQGRDILVHDGRTFVLSGSRCFSTVCGTLIEVDEFGEKIWARQIPWKVGFPALDIVGDTLVVGGFDFSNTEEMLISKFSLDGEDLDVKRLKGEAGNAFWVTGLAVYNDDIIVLGSVAGVDSTHDLGAMYWSHADGSTDSLVLIDAGDRDNEVIQARIDQEGLLTVSVNSLFYNTNGNSRLKIDLYKFDDSKEIMWEWHEIFNSSTSVQEPPLIAVLNNGTIAVLMEADFSGDKEIWGLDGNSGSILWKYDVDYTINSTGHYIYRINASRDGGLIVAGEFTSSDDSLESGGYLLKLDAEGKRVWDRVYIDRQPEFLDWYTNNALLDVVEMPNGDFLATGINDQIYIDDNNDTLRNGDTWIIRTNENGCIYDPECNREQDFNTSLNQLLNSEFELTIFPNPSTGIVKISSPKEYLGFEIDIYNASGNLLLHQAGISKYLNLSTLPNGFYFLLLKDENGRSWTKKLVLN